MAAVVSVWHAMVCTLSLFRVCKVGLNGSSSLGFACFSMLSFSLSDNQPVRDCHSFAARLVEKYYSLQVSLADS